MPIWEAPNNMPVKRPKDKNKIKPLGLVIIPAPKTTRYKKKNIPTQKDIFWNSFILIPYFKAFLNLNDSLIVEH